MEDSKPHVLFHGQQDDEQILYIIRPHPIRLALTTLFAGMAGLCLGAVGLFLADRIDLASRFGIEFSGLRIAIGLIAGLLSLLLWYWQLYIYNNSRSFITDRRFVRIEPSFPLFITKRALFWNEVAKVKAYAPSLLFRFMKVGTLQFQPTITPLEDVRVGYVYYYEDLANYIDKILFKQKSNPAEIREIRPFVTKPKGERY